MNFQDTAQVLAAIQIYDNRKIDETTVKAWHKMLWRFTLEDCLHAVDDYFRNSDEWLMPVHIIRRVKSIRSRRLALVGDVRPNNVDAIDSDGNLAADYDDKRDQITQLIANGQITKRQYDEYQNSHEGLGRLTRAAQPLNGN